jgi:limonene-1,2-epoxide hydrolase
VALTRSAEAVVRAFCDAWERRDLDGVLGWLAEDVAYQNVPQPVMQGKSHARRFIGPIIRETHTIEFVLLNVVALEEAGLVLTERLDRLYYAGGLIEIPLMGIFVVREGQIAQWRDYADSATVAWGFANAGVKLVLDPERWHAVFEKTSGDGSPLDPADGTKVKR